MISPNLMRRDLIEMAFAAKSRGAHLGGSLSMVEIIASLYSFVLKFDVKNPQDPARDRFILSKGHGVMALYPAFKQLGILTQDQIVTYKADNSIVSAHPVMDSMPFIEFSSGSLGQGLSLGVGTCLALIKKNNLNSRVFVLLGDGECDEGQVWEAAACASHYKTSNLVAIIDKNELQYDGKTTDVLNLESLADKWCSFGFNVIQVDGHDVKALTQALNNKTDKPLAVIAKTVKGKGISFMENNAQWHNGVLSKKLYEDALKDLENTHA